LGRTSDRDRRLAAVPGRTSHNTAGVFSLELLTQTTQIEFVHEIGSFRQTPEKSPRSHPAQRNRQKRRTFQNHSERQACRRNKPQNCRHALQTRPRTRQHHPLCIHYRTYIYQYLHESRHFAHCPIGNKLDTYFLFTK